jgi:ribosomal protein S1
MEILEFYRNVKKGEICRKKTKALERLKSTHPVINAVKNFADMMKDVKGFVFNWDFDWDEDKEFYKKIEETENKYTKQMNEFDANYREIKALLTDCETYEQKQNILKAYGVIDEQGKLRK